MTRRDVNLGAVSAHWADDTVPDVTVALRGSETADHDVTVNSEAHAMRMRAYDGALRIFQRAAGEGS